MYVSYQPAPRTANSLDQTDEPSSHPASDLSTYFDEPVRKPVHGGRKVKTVLVKCYEDTIEVVIRADLFGHGSPVEPTHLRLGPIRVSEDHCYAKVSGHGQYTLIAPLSECGTTLKLTEDSVVYSTLLLYTPPPPSPGDVFLTEGFAIPILCKYKRRYSVSSSALRPTWIPFRSTQSTHLPLDFHLKLMTNDWDDERQSPVYFLGDMVNIEASVDIANQLPLRLYVNSCVATLTPDVNSQPRYPFIDHEGCFTDAQLTGSSSRFLPRRHDKLLQIHLQPFLFHQDNRHAIYITCYLEASPISKMDPVKKACSFIEGRWSSVDGDDDVCESCGKDEDGGPTSSAKPPNYHSIHKRAFRSKTKDMKNELHKETTLGPFVFLPWKSQSAGNLK